MALWKDVVSQWDEESRSIALKEIIRDRAEKHVTQEELVGFSEKKYKIPVWVER